MEEKKNKFSIGVFLLLQVALLVSSFGAVCSKMAGKQEFLSFKFFLFYGILILILFVYAIVWQQVIKRMPLVIAYACRGVGIIYGIIWGVTIFKEQITWKMIVGAVLVLIGVYILIFSDLKKPKAAEEIAPDTTAVPETVSAMEKEEITGENGEGGHDA